MARDWSIPATLADVLAKMEAFGPNCAEFPFSMYQQRNEEGELVWIVEIHIKVRRVTEFDVSTEGVALTDALRAAYLGLNGNLGIVERAAKANHVFGVAV